MPGVDTPRASLFVSADITRFCECVRILRDVAKAPDLVEVTLARSLNQEPGYAWLGFMTFHSAGWWERNGMAVPYTSQAIARRVVVDLAALTEHLESIRAAESAGTTGVEWSAGSLVVGGFVVRSRPGTVPNIPVVGPVRDSVYMASGANAWRGAIVETEQGRVAVPPPLVAHLQYRKAAVVEFGAVDGEVVLVAQSDQHGHPSKVAPTIVAPVELLTWTEDAEPAQVEERRRGGREVEQLLAALDPATPVHTLLELLDTSIGYIRRRVAANPGLPESVIDEIAEHGTVAMRIGVAGNAVLPERSVRRLVSDPESMVRAALAANEHVGPELVGALAWDLRSGSARCGGDACTGNGRSASALGGRPSRRGAPDRGCASRHRCGTPGGARARSGTSGVCRSRVQSVVSGADPRRSGRGGSAHGAHQPECLTAAVGGWRSGGGSDAAGAGGSQPGGTGAGALEPRTRCVTMRFCVR